MLQVSDKQMSLLDRKRLQWAQERAEMESLRSPWGLPPPAYNIKLAESRSRFASSLEIRTTCPPQSQKDLLPRRQRSPSLPPILKSGPGAEHAVDGNQYYGSKGQLEGSNNKYRYEDAEGETSGYASEAAPQASPELWRAQQKMKGMTSEMECQCEESNTTLKSHPISAWQHERSVNDSRDKHRFREHAESEGESRPKWGDRGVAVGRLWEPHEVDSRLPQAVTKGPPSWVERGLNSIENTDTQLMLIEHMSTSSSLENYDAKSRSNADRYTYLLGQNTPIESSIKAERESRRLKALELQAAIIQQLEERELKKKAEKERRMKEEKEEEERFKKQKDLEIQRLQEERKQAEEKQLREQRRAEALRQAFEKAEQQAKQEKENKKMKKLRDNFDSMSLNSESIPPDSPKKCPNLQDTSYKESKLIQNIYIEQAFSPRRKVGLENETPHPPQSVSAETNIIMSNPQSERFTRNFDSSSHEDIKKHDQSIQPSEHSQSITSLPSLIPDSHVSLVPIPLAHDMFTPVHMAHAAGMQMAVLMPQHIYQCVHPVSMQPLYPTDAHFQHYRNCYQAPLNTDTDDSSTNKVLIPTKYKNPNSKDVSTQTDFDTTNLSSPKKLNEYTENNKSSEALDQNTDQTTSDEKLNSLNKKEKRIDDKYKEIGNRPKWGVNKPPTQYKKQSEKDIFFTQKRKLRSRKRIQEKQYTSHSSDENRSPSPQEIPKSYHKLDRGRVSLVENYWRKNSTSKPEKAFSLGNLSIETTEISHLECDKTGIVRISNNSTSSTNHSATKVSRDSTPQTKRLSLSQKFMNDKYGNPKIWSNESQSEERKPTGKKDMKDEFNIKQKEKSAQKKYFLESINKVKKEQSKYYCESDPTKPVILDQLKSLKDSLKKQQQIWGKYEATRSPSPKKDMDLETE